MHINREELKKKNQETQVSETRKEEVSSVFMQNSEEPIPKSVPTGKKEETKLSRKKLPAKYIWLIALLAVILIATCFKIYLDNSYKPQNQEAEIDDSSLNIEQTDNMLVVRNPKLGETKHKIGIVFYQDNRIDAKSYLPLMKKLALLGYDCFLPIAFGNQAYLNVDGADSVIRKYESIKTWVVAGHAGSCKQVSEFTAENPDKVQGIIFLGGYSGYDLSKTSISALSIIGTNDTIINLKTFENSKKLLPKNAEFETLEGGNNSGFADISLRVGDSKASLSFDQQTDKTTKLIHKFLQTKFDN